MKAMIFAAGLGTRLRPLTNDRPKAMVEINGMPLLEIAIRYLIKHGYTDIMVNVHHFAELIIDFLKEKDNFGINITISDERGQLLETGGGLKKAAWFFDDSEPFLVYNVDVVTDLDLGLLRQAHLDNHAIATLAVRNRSTSRYLLFGEQNVLSGWKNVKTEEIRLSRGTESTHLQPFAFSGIHIISPDIFQYFTHEGKFSIIETYLEVAKNHTILGYNHDNTNWLDVGKLPAIPKAEAFVKTQDLALPSERNTMKMAFRNWFNFLKR